LKLHKKLVIITLINNLTLDIIFNLYTENKMLLKISSPSKIIYEWKIKQITLPTEWWMITILPNHNPLVTALKPGIINIVPTQKPTSSEFLFSKNSIPLSVSKGMVFVDGKIVRIVTAVATTNPKDSQKKLKTMKENLEWQIKLLKKKWSIEEIEKSLIQLEKINADIKLERIKHISN